MVECNLCGYPVGSDKCNANHGRQEAIPAKRAGTMKPYAHYHGSVLLPVNYILEHTSSDIQEKIDEVLKRAVDNITDLRIRQGIALHRNAKRVRIEVTLVLE